MRPAATSCSHDGRLSIRAEAVVDTKDLRELTGPRPDTSPPPYTRRPQAHVDVASISQLASPAGSGFSLFTHVSQSLRSIDRSESTHFRAKS